MTRTNHALLLAMMIPLCGLTLAQKQDARIQPKIFTLECAGGDCPLLTGTPQTGGMRGGAVKLKPGESVGWHSTGQNEEALVILKGSGVAKIDGQHDLTLHERELVYIPASTRHNVTNTNAQPLEYVWIVAQVR